MIAAIELSMLAALRDAADVNIFGYKWRTLETYPDNWDEYLAEKSDWRAPAAWAVFAGASDLSFTAQGRVRIGAAEFGLVVAAENLRSETATRHGGPGTARPGSYQLAMDALSLLAGSALGLDIDMLRPVRIAQVRPFAALKQRKVSMFALQFRTAFEIDIVDLAALDDLETIHLDWDVPALGGVDANLTAPGVQLPAPASGPGSADAADHLSLQEEAP
jgi:phage gp37-like protein